MSYYAFIHRHDHRKPPKSKSGLKGVYFHKQFKSRPWKAYIRQRGQYLCLGYFATKEEAGRAYNAVAKQIKGEGTYLNPV